MTMLLSANYGLGDCTDGITKTRKVLTSVNWLRTILS